MKLAFLRKPARDATPLVVSMTGVRLGDRVIFAGANASLLLPLAARTGLSGQLLVVGAQAAAVSQRAEREGHLVETATTPPTDATYDVAVVEAIDDWSDLLKPLQAAVRGGGRIVVIMGAELQGPFAFLKAAQSRGPEASSVVAALERSGWQRARAIGGRDGIEFVEAVRTT